MYMSLMLLLSLMVRNLHTNITRHAKTLLLKGFLEFTKSGSLSGVGCPVAFLWGADFKFQFDQEKIGRSFGTFFGDKNIITESGL